MAEKVSVATVWLDGCSGCHMSFLDIDEVLLDLADKISLVYSPLVDNKIFPDNVDLCLIEGAVSNEDDLKKIRHVRRHTKTLVSLGDCAVTGNVPSMRNRFKIAELAERAYFDNADDNQHLPDVVVPPLLPKVKPVHHVVEVDYFLPGCPPNAAVIGKFLTDLLAGREPEIDSHFG